MSAVDAEKPLTLEWSFGFNCRSRQCVHSLTDSTRDALFFPAAHMGVIYDLRRHTQTHLQGHCNMITACAVSRDKRWIVTADAGEDSVLVVWESTTQAPVRTIFQPHPGGVAALALSQDATRIVTVSATTSRSPKQRSPEDGGDEADGDASTGSLCVWDWASEQDGPVAESALPTSDPVLHVTFHPDNANQLVTTSPERVVFWGVVEEEGTTSLAFYAPPVSRNQLDTPVAPFTATTFLPGTASALSSTSDGTALLWDSSPSAVMEGRLLEKSAMKVVRLINKEYDPSMPVADRPSAGISWIGVVPVERGEKRSRATTPATTRTSQQQHNRPASSASSAADSSSSDVVLVVTGEDGAVRVFDVGLRLLAWFDEIDAGPIVSISFSAPGSSVGIPSDESDPTSVVPLPDCIVATRRGLVVGLQASLFAELNPDDRRGSLLLQGVEDGVYGLAAHPHSPQMLVGTRGGTVQLWDWDARSLLLVRLVQEEAEEEERARMEALHQPRDAGAKFKPDEFAVTAMAWHPSGLAAAIATGGGPTVPTGAVIRFIDGSTLGDLQLPLGGKDKTTRWSADPKRVGATRGGERTSGGGGGGGSMAAQASTGGGRGGEGPLGPEGLVTHLKFSDCGSWLAAADDKRYVTLWHFTRVSVRANADRKEWELEDGEEAATVEQEQWVYVGRARSHTATITGLEWCTDPADSMPRLVTVGEDRRCVEYDIQTSSATEGLVVKRPRVRLEQTGLLTSCLWLPPGSLPGSRELLLATANDEYKLKLWNGANKACRKTVLAPTFGGPLTQLLLVPPPTGSKQHDGSAAPDGGKEDGEGEGTPSGDSHVRIAVFGTSDRVIGVLLLPLDGNPNRSVGVIAHPGRITGLSVTHDGRHVLSGGGEDGTVGLWRIHHFALEEVAAAGGEGLEPFLAMLPGGAHGSFYQEIYDFFAYAQIRSQGEESTRPRASGISLPLQDLPALMRALGYYPTEAEAEALCNEVRYGSFEEQGKTVEDVELSTVIRLYVNHRPVLGVGREAIQDALRIIGEHAVPAPTPTPGGTMDWQTLRSILSQRGEPLADEELETCLTALTGQAELPAATEIDTDRMAQDILGFVEDDAESYGNEDERHGEE